MAEASPRVVLLSLDAFVARHLGPVLTPRLWALAATGGRAPDGGRCPMPSATYSSHATLLTGRLPGGHGVWSGLAAAPEPGVVPGWAGAARVATPTLFDAGRAAGVRTAAILGDQHLPGVIGAEVADVVWPSAGALPPGAPTDAFGYAANAAVRAPLLAAIRDGSLGFVFGHINETDTIGHQFGPDHPEAIAAHARADSLVGEVLDALAADWARSMVIVVSDHDMEAVGDEPAIDLLADPAVAALARTALSQGGSALVRPREGVHPARAGAALADVPGVTGWSVAGPEMVLVEGEPGRWFRVDPPPPVRGFHGGPGAALTLAVIGGGHQAVAAIAAAIGDERLPPALADWAPTIAAVLGLDLGAVEGRNLAGG